MQTVKLGIIGCGIIASELHVPALKALMPRFDPCAFCNRTPEKAIKMANYFGYGKNDVWTDWKKFLEEADVEAVLICMPIDMNYEVGSAAAAAGKHVICEKPLGASLDEARKAVDTPQKYGITYLLAENYHYHPTFSQAAELVEEGAIGNVEFMSWNAFRFMEKSNKYAHTSWRMNHKYPGGYVLDGGVHNTHVIQMVAGNVKAVTGLTRSVEPFRGKIDTALALIEHENGVHTTLNMSWAALNDQKAYSLRIFGSKGSLIVDNNSIKILEVGGRQKHISISEGSGFYQELQDFHLAVTTGKQLSMTNEMALHDVEVILGILESAETGRKVTL